MNQDNFHVKLGDGAVATFEREVGRVITRRAQREKLDKLCRELGGEGFVLPKTLKERNLKLFELVRQS